MKNYIIMYLLSLSFLAFSQSHTIEIDYQMKPNAPLLNFENYEKLVKEAGAHRAERLISWQEFQQKVQEPNTLILDARSARMYKASHLKGAQHLNFSEFDFLSLEELTQPYAGKETQILIYCNNNISALGNEFTQNGKIILNSSQFYYPKVMPLEHTYPQKEVTNDNAYLALNIPTYLNLYGYGYQNVYELNELIDLNDPTIEFEGTNHKTLNSK